MTTQGRGDGDKVEGIDKPLAIGLRVKEGGGRRRGVEQKEEDVETGGGLNSRAVEAVVHHVVEILVVGDEDKGVEVFEYSRPARDDIGGR